MRYSNLSNVFQTSLFVVLCTVSGLASALPQTGTAQLEASQSTQRISAVFRATPLAEALHLLQAKAPLSFEIADPSKARAPVSAVIDAKTMPEAIKLMLDGYGYVMQEEPGSHGIKLVIYSTPEQTAAQSSVPTLPHSDPVTMTYASVSSEEEDEEPDQRIYPPWQP